MVPRRHGLAMTTAWDGNDAAWDSAAAAWDGDDGGMGWR
jgi:hypothetical protein